MPESLRETWAATKDQVTLAAYHKCGSGYGGGICR